MEIFDIIDEGYIGLIKAAEIFAPDRKALFIIYAKYWVYGEISKNLKVKLQKKSYNKSTKKSDVEDAGK